VSPSERKLYNALQRRSAEMSPELAAAILRAFARIRESMTEAALIRALALGFADRIVEQILTQAILDVAFQPVRQRLRETLRVSVPYYARTMPPTITREVSIAFDVLSPHVLDGIRTLESRVITSLQTEVRETVRAAVSDGLANAKSYRAAAKNIRAAVGLAPNQLQEVDNYRVKLQHAHEKLDALDNKLRDKRFDSVIRKARASGEPIPTERIDKMVDAYRKRRIAQHASTVAGTAAKDAQRLANRLAWENAVDMGAVDRNDLWKRRMVVLDGRERPEHHVLSRQERPFDAPYSNGEMVSGDQSWGCRCTDTYFVRTA
jgi:hypothetical protein